MQEIPDKSTLDSYTADEFTDGMKDELQSIVSNTGQAFNQANQTQLMQGLLRIAGSGIFMTDTGGANAYVLNLAVPFSNKSISAYNEGMIVKFIAANANSDAATVTVAAVGASAIVDGFGNALLGGEIQPNTETSLVRQGGTWTLLRSAREPRVMVRIGGTATAGGFGVILGASPGVSGVVSPAVGRLVITFNQAFSDTFYFQTVSSHDVAGGSHVATVVTSLTTTLTTEVQVFGSTTGTVSNNQGGVTYMAWDNV